jgi:hypothetical protein
MTERKANANARTKEEADPCGMTTRKARATAKYVPKIGLVRGRRTLSALPGREAIPGGGA